MLANLGWARHWKSGRWGRLTEVSYDGTYYKLYFPDLLQHEWRRASAFIIVSKWPREWEHRGSEESSTGTTSTALELAMAQV